jgi:hypothetical protein
MSKHQDYFEIKQFLRVFRRGGISTRIVADPKTTVSETPD